MASAANKVIEGEFKNRFVFYDGNGVNIDLRESNFGKLKSLYLDNHTVKSYQLVDQSSDVSLTSALTRGAVGHAVAGDVGGIAGAMTAKSKGIHVVLITYKNDKKSIIEIDDLRYNLLKKKCMYNVDLEDSSNNDDFDLYKEVQCPHCKSVVVGNLYEKCPVCKRPYSMPKKEWRSIDKIIVPLLIFLYPVGLIMMWVNKSFYLRTRVTITILCVLVTIIAIAINSQSNTVGNESGSIDNIVIEKSEIRSFFITLKIMNCE